MKIVEPIFSTIRVEPTNSQAGSLSGIECAIKDNIDIAGGVTGAGHPLWFRTHRRATSHAYVVDTLLKAGVHMVGKTIMDELAYSLSGKNPHYGALSNTNAQGHLVGGSSCGSAVAVASGRVPLAIGTDTAGSIRLPASYCGIWGLRTTYGAIPMDGVIPLSSSFDALGFHARDPALLSKVTSLFNLSEQHNDHPRLVFLTDAIDELSTSHKKRFERLQDNIQVLFSTVAETSLGEELWLSAMKYFPIVQGYEAWQAHGQWIEANQPAFSKPVEARFQQARKITEKEYGVALNHCAMIKQQVDTRFGRDSYICMPTVPHVAPKILATEESLQKTRLQALRLLTLASITGRPELSMPLLPCGPSQLPLGVSLLAYPYFDQQLCDMGAVIHHEFLQPFIEQVS